MKGRAALMAIAAGACSHAEPARAATVECHGTANARSVAGLDIAQACALVQARTQAVLTSGGAVTIELDLSRSGSAIARVREVRSGETHVLPEVAVDVMDRALAREDLIRLADAIAAALNSGR